MSERKKEERLGDALLKVALGYQVAEVTEEYAEVDGELKLTKRKKTKKDIPPDLKAVQLLLAADGKEEYGQWTDEELEVERKRLLAALKETENSALGEQKEVLKKEKDGGMVELKTKKPRPKPRKRVVRKTKK